MHRRYLFDVDGNIVRGTNGGPLNLYSPAIRDYVDQGAVRFIYDLPREYRYIITSPQQMKRFRLERERGSRLKQRIYHVYFDQDATVVPLLQSRIAKDRVIKKKGVHITI